MRTTPVVACLIVLLSVPSGAISQNMAWNVMHFNGLLLIDENALGQNSFVPNSMAIQSLRPTKGLTSRTEVNLSFLGGGALYESFQWGGGLEFGVTVSRWLYIGAFASTHFTENFNNSFVGGDLGYSVDFEKFTLRPFVNLGVIISTGLESGHSSTAFYLGPALAFTYWVMPNFGIGPDLRLMYLPDHEDSYGGYYMGFVILL